MATTSFEMTCNCGATFDMRAYDPGWHASEARAWREAHQHCAFRVEKVEVAQHDQRWCALCGKHDTDADAQLAQTVRGVWLCGDHMSSDGWLVDWAIAKLSNGEAFSVGDYHGQPKPELRCWLCSDRAIGAMPVCRHHEDQSDLAERALASIALGAHAIKAGQYPPGTKPGVSEVLPLRQDGHGDQ